MKKALILLAVAIVLIPSLAYSDILTFRLGYFSPQALNNLGSHPDSLWAIELSQMSMAKSDYRGALFGFGYEHFLSPKLSVTASVDFYNKQNGGYYLDYVSNLYNEVDRAFPYADYYGDDILHTFHVSMTPIQFSLKFYPLGRKSSFVPYFGGGGGPYFIRAEIYGYMIDFSDVTTYPDPDLGDVPVYGIYYVDAHETKVVLGGHVFAGFMIPIGYRLTLEVEARYHFASASFDSGFIGYDKFNMSGLSLSLGINYWF
jgi:hypothetical protein